MMKVAMFHISTEWHRLQVHINISAAGPIWLQPSSGYGPDLTEWSCGICFGEGEKPYLDFIILPILLISGGLMISDRKNVEIKRDSNEVERCSTYCALVWNSSCDVTDTER